jgi:hypothetical protein
MYIDILYQVLRCVHTCVRACISHLRDGSEIAYQPCEQRTFATAMSTDEEGDRLPFVREVGDACELQQGLSLWCIISMNGVCVFTCSCVLE